MTDVLPVLRDIASSLVLLLGTQTLTATLLLLGAATLVAAVAAATARWGTPLVVGTAARPVDRLRDAVDTGPAVTQSDPDAPGSARPRAPGLLLG
ncbi:hypothetical protein GJV82_18360 [Cellulosimicrobium sp. BIT-GX5]|uniref:Uncharacterized protein n=1 Tax=Cellulosimicrobium composti TaxID=2672572 RepID=A0A6N7ZN22_9MICO|nr:DUF6412 domain-containing protein [Cellulosimicrobium composti]MTG90884.1 hypothetical protein [Cellulosimicrobium composti]UTT60370.1 DUF6412 domain-containing protein [Cellulosimicrobium cellulans]